MKKSDFIFIKHKNKISATTVGNMSYENKVFRAKSNRGLKYLQLPPIFEHRPDLLASLVYNDIDRWAFFLEINSIFDPFDGMNAGDYILV